MKKDVIYNFLKFPSFSYIINPMDKPKEKGHIHPLTQVNNEIMGIFTDMGFEITLGPEMESEHYNFDVLNVPRDHPARDMQDTFWIKGLKETVLRTQTSPVQGRYMEKNKPPFIASVHS